MNGTDAYISDVVIVIDDVHHPFDSVVQQLTARGFRVQEIKPDQHVVEGAIESCKLREIDDLPGVEYVRSVFTYAADFDPPGTSSGCAETPAPSWLSGENRNGYRKI